MEAVKAKDLDLVSEIISEGVQIDENLPLRLASAQGSEEIVKVLLNAKANPNAKNAAALRWASAQGYPEIVRQLLLANADVHANKDKSLYFACYFENEEVIQLLLDAGAVFNSSWTDVRMPMIKEEQEF